MIRVNGLKAGWVGPGMYEALEMLRGDREILSWSLVLTRERMNDERWLRNDLHVTFLMDSFFSRTAREG